MLPSYGKVHLKVLSLLFFGITFQNYTYTFFGKITLLKYLPLSRKFQEGWAMLRSAQTALLLS